ncbi:MAG: hypothetical protein ACXACX_02875 [Candidatus Hodarchaeales archaeon]
MVEIINLPYELVISYYDIKIGPIVLIKFGMGISENEVGIPENKISNLMDFHTDGQTFSHCYVQYDKIISLNHCFALKDKKTRGGCHDLMISVLFKKQINISKREYLYTIFDNIDNLELWLEGISEQICKEKNIKSMLNSPNTTSLYKNNEINKSLTRCLKRNIRKTIEIKNF